MKSAQAVAYLGARLGRRDYLLGCAQVVEVMQPQPMTPVPHAPSYIRGVFSRRGRVTPLFDLGAFANDGDEAPPARIIVVQADDLVVGLPSLKIYGMMQLEDAAIEPPLPEMRALGAYVRGHYRNGERHLWLLDIEQLLQLSRPRGSG